MNPTFSVCSYKTIVMTFYNYHTNEWYTRVLRVEGKFLQTELLANNNEYREKKDRNTILNKRYCHPLIFLSVKINLWINGYRQFYHSGGNQNYNLLVLWDVFSAVDVLTLTTLKKWLGECLGFNDNIDISYGWIRILRYEL